MSQVSLVVIFGRDRQLVIGAIHLPPLLGYEGFPGLDAALERALLDLRAFESGGVDGIIFENNYDLPHRTEVSPAVVSALTYLGEGIRSATSLPVGVSVLWNDYRAALSVARVLGLQFIRVPVFVDDVEASHGTIRAEPERVLEFRRSIGADRVALFVDVHVKHARLLSGRSLAESAELSLRHGADAVIVTGSWTGKPPSVEEVRMLRDRLGDQPLLIGSGVDRENVAELLSAANGAVVSTSLKEGESVGGEINVKPYSRRISEDRVRELMAALK